MAGSLRDSSLALASTMLMVALPAAAFEAAKPVAGSRVHAAISVKAVPSGAVGEQADGRSAAGRDTVAVMIDHAKVVRLPERTQTVVVGNPMIADITVQRNGIVVVTGKSYGITNVIALDGAGTLIAEVVHHRAGGDGIGGHRAARSRAGILFLHAQLPALDPARRFQQVFQRDRRPGWTAQRARHAALIEARLADPLTTGRNSSAGALTGRQGS